MRPHSTDHAEWRRAFAPLIILAAALGGALGALSVPAAAGDRWGAPVSLYDRSLPMRVAVSVTAQAPNPVHGAARVVDWQAIARANAAAAPAGHSASASPSSAAARQKIGRPYQIEGVWYVPAREDDYDEVGVASWYGPQFHGRATANGEVFNMHQMTAAHPTLPIPSIARVTNVETGAVVEVRINDRGPFARGRIIDLSKAAAGALGFQNQGTAQVRVEYLRAAVAGEIPPTPSGGGSSVMAASAPVYAPAARPTPLQSGPVHAASHTPPPVAAPAAVPSSARMVAAPPMVKSDVMNADGTLSHAVALGRPMVAPSGLFVQVGSFQDPSRATRVAAQISGPTFVQPAYVNAARWHRVMVGPWPSRAAAEEARAAIASLGHVAAKVVESL